MGSSYIELPAFIKNKKACVNIPNCNNKCFLWCFLASTHYNVDVKGGCKNKASSYKLFREIKEPEKFFYCIEIGTHPEINFLIIKCYTGFNFYS